LKEPVGPAEKLRSERIASLREAHADDAEFGHCLLADEARQLGFPMADRTAWRLCNQSGIMSAIVKNRKKKGKTPGPPVCNDLVQRNFTATAANQLWLVDITEHRTKEGKVLPLRVKDVFSRRIVGYSISDRMKARIAVDAVNNAVARRGNVTGYIVHSDRGSQFRSRKFLHALISH
jgi:transposase InsO family protein